MGERCIFCGEAYEPSQFAEHLESCDGRQGGRPEPDPEPDPDTYVPSMSAESESLEGLTNEAIDAILATVTAEQVQTLVSLLTSAPQHVDVIRRALLEQPWFPAHAKRDTQLRRMRTIRDAAVAAGFPVCSTNAGYALGDQAMVEKSANRARRFAYGADLRAAMLERLARRMAAA